MADFKGKVVVITGGAGEIGKAAAKLLLGDGAAVLLVDSNAKALEATVADLGGDRVASCVADVTDVASTQAYIRAAVERFGGIDVLLSNAGIEGKVVPIFDADPADFDKVIAVNVRGVWLSLKYAIPEMRKRGGGSIIISSSVAGLRGTAGVTPYCTSKHAVIGLMRAAALECAPFNIRVNTVNPSPVETRMMRSLEEGLMPGNPGEVRAMLKAMIPLQRYAEADDIAKLMRFLASDDSAFITGSVYSADGGLNAG